jgi:hypothetical protein
MVLLVGVGLSQIVNPSGGSGDTITSPNSTLSVGGTSSNTTLDLSSTIGQATTFLQLDGCVHVNADQSFATALAATPNPGCMEIDPGTYAVNTNATIPGGVTVRFTSGGLLSISTSVVLSFFGVIDAPPEAQIFTYTGGVVAFGNGTQSGRMSCLWFPGVDVFAKCNNAALANQNANAQIYLPPAIYPGVTTTLNGQSLTDFVFPGSTITWTGTSGCAITISATGNVNMTGSRIQGPLNLIGTRAAGTTGICIGNATASQGLTEDITIEDVTIGSGVGASMTNGFDNGVHIDGNLNSGVYDIHLRHVKSGGNLHEGIQVKPTLAARAGAITCTACSTLANGDDGLQIDGGILSDFQIDTENSVGCGVDIGPTAVTTGITIGPGLDNEINTIGNVCIGGHSGTNAANVSNFTYFGLPGGVPIGNPGAGNNNSYMPLDANPWQVFLGQGSIYDWPVGPNTPSSTATINMRIAGETSPCDANGTSVFKVLRSGAGQGAITFSSPCYPLSNLWLGTAATNNFKFTPAATAAARTVNILDPGGTTTLNLANATTTTANFPMLSTTTAGLQTPGAVALPNAAVAQGGLVYANTTTAITASGLITLNKLVKSGGSGAPSASSVTDDGTTVATAEPFKITEGTASGAGATIDTLHADSTQHAWEVNNNNTGEMPVSRVACANVTPVTVAASVTTDQNLQACSFSANLLNVAGRTIRIWTAGVYSTAATSTAQITLKAKLCTVSGCASGTVINLDSIQTIALASVTVTNNAWNLAGYSSTQTAGATAAFESHGILSIDLGSLTTAADSIFDDVNTATISSIDSTAALFLQITGAYSAASTSNSMTGRQLIVEVLN